MTDRMVMRGLAFGDFFFISDILDMNFMEEIKYGLSNLIQVFERTTWKSIGRLFIRPIRVCLHAISAPA